MRILLVYPEMPDTFYALRYFIELAGKRAAFPPLGLMTVSSLLPAHFEKRLVDCNVATLNDSDIDWADYIFISAMNVQEESVRDIIRQCKARDAKIVAGGPLFTHEHDRFPEVDHFVLNEAEITIHPFLSDLEQQTLKPIYSSPAFADITESPLPDFGMVDMKKYLYAIVQYSRGCPYLCDFCDVTALFGRKPRTKTTDQIIAELEAIMHQGNVNLVLFADDNLIGNKRILKDELLPALIEWRRKKNPPFYFATQLTINLEDDPELMKLMADAGFCHVFIGIETADEESLKQSHKNQNLKRNLLDTINRIHERGFIISGGFIVGFDTDTPASFANLRDFIQLSGIPLPIVNILKAPPGTELYERMKRENRLIKDFAFEEGDTNIAMTMGEEQVLKGFLDVIDGLYPPQFAIERIKTFFTHHRFLNGAVPIRQKFTALEMVTYLFSMLRLLFIEPDRKYYWELLRWTYRFNVKFMDKAIFYCMMMYQMKKIHQHIRDQVNAQLMRIQDQKQEPVAITGSLG